MQRVLAAAGHRRRVHHDDAVPGRGGHRLRRLGGAASARRRGVRASAKSVLAGAVSRWRWLFTAVAAAVVGSAVLMFFAGLGNGLGAGITLGEPGDHRAPDAGRPGVRARDGGDGRCRGAGRRAAPGLDRLARSDIRRRRRCISARCCACRSGCSTYHRSARPRRRPTCPVVALTVMVVVARAAGTLSRGGSIAAATRLMSKGNHEDRTATWPPRSFSIVFFGVALFWPGWHVRLLAGLGFHRRVPSPDDGAHPLSGRAIPLHCSGA